PGPEDTTRDVSSTFVLPSQVVEFIVPPSRGRPVPPASGGKLEPAGRNRWRWTAPAAPGLYPIRIPALKRESFHVLNAFVQVPFRQIRNGRLNGYRIGSYPPPRGPAYQRPEGFVEVTPGN